MARDPWFKFYPADWNNDIKLQSCSLAAQGLLIKLMCFMHQSTRPGYFLINGEKPNKTSTKRITNCHQNEYKTKLKELINAGVLTEDDGVVVCPRMVRDQAFRDASREAGKKGGNPALVNLPLNPTLKPRCQKSDVRSQKEITTTTKDMLVLTPEDISLDKAKQVIEYLNKATNSKFRPVGKNVDLVRTRLREGFTVEDCMAVIDGQKMDPYFLENPKYFRPSTLFGSKIEGYLSAAPKQKAALERDPKKMIADMRAAEELRRFVEGADES